MDATKSRDDESNEHLDHEDYLLKCREKNAEKQRRFREAERKRLNTSGTDNIIKQTKECRKKKTIQKSPKRPTNGS